MSTQSLQTTAATTVNIMGASITILVSSDQTEGIYSVVEVATPPRLPGPPLHMHKRMTESFYVLSGTPELFLDGVWTSVSPGESFVVPSNTLHSYRNPTDRPARFLAVAPGHDRFFLEIAEWMQREPSWPPPDRQALGQFLSRHDTFYAAPPTGA